ncbi:MAG: hypothetical protein VX966_09145 [Chloroflexota bacterium]|nr:hypothetical protein [Chloroflexota bacterium]
MASAKGEEPHYKDIFEGEYPAGVSEAIESVRKAIETNNSTASEIDCVTSTAPLPKS